MNKRVVGFNIGWGGGGGGRALIAPLDIMSWEEEASAQ